MALTGRPYPKAWLAKRRFRDYTVPGLILGVGVGGSALVGIAFKSFPDGGEREGWPDTVYIRARPNWIRYSDYNRDPPAINETS